MAQPKIEREQIAQLALNMLPRSLRRRLLSDNEFCEKNEIKTEVKISFQEDGPSFKRSDFFRGVVAVFEHGQPQVLKATDGTKAELLPGGSTGSPLSATTLIMRQEGRTDIALDGFYALSPNDGLRREGLRMVCEDHPVPTHIKAKWSSRLAEGPLTQSEYESFLADCSNISTNFFIHVKSCLEQGATQSDDLVPKESLYFSTIVGQYDDANQVSDQIRSQTGSRIRELLSWDDLKGLRLALFIGAHPRIATAFDTSLVSIESLNRIIAEFSQSGDFQSKITAIELGLSLIKDSPHLESGLSSLICKLVDEDPRDERSIYHVFSALFVFTYAEMARRRILRDAPPFYRRLAASAHASLLLKAIQDAAVDPMDFVTWSVDNCTGRFYLQSLVDMRKEPRWYPDLIHPAQLRQEAIGRILIASENNKRDIPDGELHALLFDDKGLRARANGPAPFFPGILDGSSSDTNELPQSISTAIEEQLDGDVADIQSFVAIVNSATLFRIPSDFAERAASLLKAGRYHLSHVQSEEELMTVLFGLARVAAVSRSAVLAKELVILSRKYRSDPQFSFHIEHSLWLLLTSAAAIEDHSLWVEYVGDFLVELSFEEMGNQQAEMLLSQLECLCHVEPMLWTTASRADAALRAFLRRP